MNHYVENHYVELDVEYSTCEECSRTGTLLPTHMLIWMESEIGERHDKWDWWITSERFSFKHEEDRVKFILRWL